MNKEFLMKLLNTASPSGYEREAAELWREEAEKFSDSVYGSPHGNSVAVRCGIRTTVNLNLNIMLAGHIDEIGLIIDTIDKEKGFLYFSPIGGWDVAVLIGQRVTIYTRSGKIITGCIGRQPIHLLESEDTKQMPKMKNLWIDVNKQNVKDVSIGDYAVIDYKAEFLDADKNILIARGIDDRIGAFIVLEVLKTLETRKIKSKIIHAVATAQEEIGLRGAKTSAHEINPDIGIAVDVTFATDHPESDTKRADVRLGHGPVITIGPNIHPYIYDLLIKTAVINHIPYQLESAPEGTGTDANIIQLCRKGVATALISIPCRYIHSPNEMVDLRDVENAIKLLTLFCHGEIRKKDLII